MKTASARARALLSAAVLPALAACSTPADGIDDADDPTGESLGHVHALVHDPGTDQLLAATHTGVWLLPDPTAPSSGEDAVRRVGAGTQDTMGMALGPDGALYASGHPGPGEDPDLSPPNLGLQRSTDGATTWEPVSLRGEVDFHALTTATTPDGSVRVAGLDSGTSTILVSDDAGRSWSQGATLALRDLAFLAGEADSLVATTPGGVQVSDDAAGSFAPVPDAPLLVLVEVLPAGGVVGLDDAGTVWTAGDDLTGWRSHGGTDEVVEALTTVPTADGKDTALVVATSAAVLVSDDLGGTWDELAAVP
ncbi:hypothetical protein ATJ88_0154 [Isoptericola jiangsuensis]|uniref:BNR/Asp-box repeat protein n=1 Tax=Isoptericola jiangsuensis TaxID=548579 RepID=A0A2A9ETC1_9MICO|nr:hypothetical protein [Isoptericola jiangsuensis]PFG41512.1 hypothetical protein ATJ88_0154 [Isoptericola jiangsuensis]